MTGIDVSEHQGLIDWDKVKQYFDEMEVETFAMIRMGYGSDLESQDDEHFERNVKECERVGIPWGAYLYSYALDLEHANSEANHILRLMKGKQPDFPVSFDMEDGDNYKQKHGMPSPELLVDICYNVLEKVEYHGYYVSLYANKSWLNGRLKSDRLDRFDKWVAEWDDECSYKGSYLMWQYSSEGTVNGIDGNVDMNIAYSDFNFSEQESEDKQPEESTPFSKYVIQHGDTLSEISEQFDSNIEELMKMNPQIDNKNRIYVGQVIDVPGEQSEQPTFKKYTVQSGDTLSEIAERFNTTVNHLMKMNMQIEKRDLIFPGTRIRVPIK